jgi:beta-xylosidase
VILPPFELALREGHARAVIAYSGWSFERIVEPGEVILMVGFSSDDIRPSGALQVAGERRTVGADRILTTPVRIDYL